MQIGLGDSTTPATTTVAITATYVDGLKLWMTPSAALSAAGAVVTNPSTAFSANAAPFSLGILTPPLALLILVLGMSGGGRR